MKLLVVAALVAVAAADRPRVGVQYGAPPGAPQYQTGGQSAGPPPARHGGSPSSGQYGLKSRRKPSESPLKPVNNGYRQGYRRLPTATDRATDGYRRLPTGLPTATDGYRQGNVGSSPNSAGFSSQSTGGYRSQSTGGYTSQANGGYKSQSNGGYRSRSNGGYRSQSNGGYKSQSNEGFSQISNGRYTSQYSRDFNQLPSRAHSKPEPTPAPQPYSFSYNVLDVLGNDYGATEESNGEQVQGQYSVLLPDGRLQTVTYSVQGDSGFVADVQYQGEARFFGADREEQGRSSVTRGSGPTAGHGYAAN